ncbi:hypothetical protein J6590_028001 [Homalodisca vitripennis]|nr:hypothetical protein J6590_028001 [Homalodisca vitripennis]
MYLAILSGGLRDRFADCRIVAYKPMARGLRDHGGQAGGLQDLGSWTLDVGWLSSGLWLEVFGWWFAGPRRADCGTTAGGRTAGPRLVDAGCRLVVFGTSARGRWMSAGCIRDFGSWTLDVGWLYSGLRLVVRGISAGGLQDHGSWTLDVGWRSSGLWLEVFGWWSADPAGGLQDHGSWTLDVGWWSAGPRRADCRTTARGRWKSAGGLRDFGWWSADFGWWSAGGLRDFGWWSAGGLRDFGWWSAGLRLVVCGTSAGGLRDFGWWSAGRRLKALGTSAGGHRIERGSCEGLTLLVGFNYDRCTTGQVVRLCIPVGGPRDGGERSRDYGGRASILSVQTTKTCDDTEVERCRISAVGLRMMI